MTKQLEEAVAKLENVEHQLETAKVEVVKPFAQEAELAEKLDRLAELNALLNMDEKGDEAVDMDDDAPKQETQADRQDGQIQHSNITYVDTQLEVRKAFEPSVSYGGKVSESKVEYAAKKPEKAESGRPFHDKLEAKKGEVAKQSPPKPAEEKSKQTSV